MFEPKLEKNPGSKMAPEHMRAMIEDATKEQDNLPPTETQRGAEYDETPEESDIPTWFEPDSKDDWAWGEYVAPLRKKDWDKDLAPIEAGDSQTLKELPRYEVDEPVSEEVIEALPNTLQSPDVPSENIQSQNEIPIVESSKLPEGFTKKESEHYEASALGRESDAAPPAVGYPARDNTDETLRAA